jgi:NAD+ kinase
LSRYGVEAEGKPMKRLGVIANCAKKRAGAVLESLAETAGREGIALSADKATATLLGVNTPVGYEEMFASVDAVMALGGDGTMLRAIRELDGRDIPVMGVNIGGLGFLTSVSEEELGRALRCLAADDFLVSPRTLVEGTLGRGDGEPGRYRALNDIVIRSGCSCRVVTLDVCVNGEQVTSYVCDGLIISTPTGSTGHSLSAGGPIVTPEARALVLSLICPHTLSSRPLVLPDASTVEVTVGPSGGDVPMSVDGQVTRTLAEGDWLRAETSDKKARFIHLPGHSYFRVLRQKLHWSGRNV